MKEEMAHPVHRSVLEEPKRKFMRLIEGQTKGSLVTTLARDRHSHYKERKDVLKLLILGGSLLLVYRS